MNISLRWLGAVFGKALSRQALSVKALPLVLAGSVLAPHTFATVADGTCPAGSLGEIATLALIQKKPALDTDDFRTYWRDIHGMLATRIPGFWTYTQHHLEEEILSAADNPARSGEQLHGFAEVTYCNEADIAGLASSAVTELIKEDEQNAFAATYLYGTRRGDSSTLIAPATTASGTNGAVGGAVILLVARADNEESAAFREALGPAFDTLSAMCPDIQRARSHFLLPYQPDAWQAPNVNHDPAVVYDAVLELGFDERATAVACLGETLLSALARAPGGQSRTVDVHFVSARYPMVKDGKPTLLGLRGLPAYQLIRKLDAGNQMNPVILEVLYGAAGE